MSTSHYANHGHVQAYESFKSNEKAALRILDHIRPPGVTSEYPIKNISKLDGPPSRFLPPITAKTRSGTLERYVLRSGRCVRSPKSPHHDHGIKTTPWSIGSASRQDIWWRSPLVQVPRTACFFVRAVEGYFPEHSGY